MKLNEKSLKSEIINFLIKNEKTSIDDVHQFFNQKLINKRDEENRSNRIQHHSFGNEILLDVDDTDKIDEIIWDLIIERCITPGTRNNYLNGGNSSRYINCNIRKLNTKLTK